MHSWPRLQFKSLISFLISSFRLKLLWFILTKTNQSIRLCPNLLQHFIVFFQFASLVLIETLFIIWFTLERQRIKWILRVFFMKYIVLTIFPVWKILLIRRKSNDWFFFIIYFFSFFISRSNLKIFEILVFCSFHIHLMRVDNFTFFF